MRFIPFIISSFITVLLIFFLDKKWGAIPPLGRFLSPQQGFWQNADPTDKNFNQHITFTTLKGKVNIYLDDRLIPHIFAEHDEDAYFVQGYLHAKFRLWQMDFQTMAAAGRISEILGNDPRFIRFDREQRRLGMAYAAEIAAKEIEKNTETKKACDAYTAGVNSFINTLTESELPIEYKLLDYKPEYWSNLKIALFLKQMSKTLAGHERDLEFTNAKSVFNQNHMELLFPQAHDSLIPIIPKGTVFSKPAIVPVKPASADSLYFNNDTTVNVKEVFKPDRNNGSNSWAVNGDKSASGAPILCNDPHLELTLPSIWYEMQITTPTMNVYGATFPGSPSVIIGFNDSIAFGFTNAQRDVKDYYQVRFKDASRKEYWFNGKWVPTNITYEQIRIRGAVTITDTVAYTIFGPVMYDESFTNDITGTNAIAVRWAAHDASNEGLMWLKLNRAKNYNDYVEAIKIFYAPGQNMLYASKSGDIAIWQQAAFPLRWKGQGLYLMPGEDSSYMWQGYIPQQENPNILNPASQFIQSANQRPVDTTYPYFIPGNYISARGITIANKLQQMQQLTPKHMMQLQNDYYSSFAADAVPLLMRYIDRKNMNEDEERFLSEISKWDYYLPPDAKAPTIFQAWFDSLESRIWSDEFNLIKAPKVLPEEQTLLELLLKDSSFRFIDNINTPEVETIEHQITAAFKEATSNLILEEKENGLIWSKHKKPSVYHLLRTALLPFARSSLPVGGWNNTLNAITTSHGPSWRMIVHLTTPTEAYGIYPGGQSGNPGSKYYDVFIDPWTRGEYYKLWVMKENENENRDNKVKWKITFSNS
jgi:penicillin amidase